ncbi:hypothetical protein CDD80_5614 [Ophiocordyceps camponoti-rufipedis]|uniref:Uncharacterized protein n=1 Tax=Ophiocordyceps camponoti-rufipedis TaxID=2004952 RepID=A0A2C5XYN8_9HYPO|nr:hypothetical protein CDD80_5614 [Ophiocordyceps camponoti-rufipedis]
MSADTVSSLFPDRPIRPLPKRRLRERLSPEVAQSIKYPPTTYDTVPLFFYPPFAVKKEATGTIAAEPANPVDPGRRSDPTLVSAILRNGLGYAAAEQESPGVRSALFPRSPPEILSRAGLNPFRPDQPRPAEPQPPPSAASSVDGYDSFENTNNKKKRKIPSAGDSAMNAAHSLNNEINSLAISAAGHSPANEAHGDRPLHGSSSFSASGPYVANNQGFSGPGRGRLGRSRNGRSPLRALSDGNNAWTARSSKSASSPWSSAPEGSGIISSAIANAGRLQSQGQDKVSLLQQHSAIPKNTPASTQFTFTCDSHVPGTVQWPGQPSKYNVGGAQPSMSGSLNGVHHDGTKTAGAKGPQSRRKSRRRLESELNAAARQRRRMAAENNLHHPPRAEDVWICEFCEYERIFGEPPRALIRDYEIKDRRHRQEEADRKRLLEKAKAKSRKGRKMARGHRTAQGSQQTADQVPADVAGEQDAPPMNDVPSHSTQSEEDEGEDGVALEGCGQPENTMRPLTDQGGGRPRTPLEV